MAVSIDSTKLYKAFKLENFSVWDDETANRVSLDKWPGCLVTGLKVDPDIASEFIRRTDSFFTWGMGGNNHKWNDKVRKIVGLPPEDQYSNVYTNQDRDEFWIRQNYFRIKWMSLNNLFYLASGRISNSYVGGYYGLVDFEGNIYHWKNIGKWPSVREVKAELETIGYAFPGIELRLTLFDSEYCCDNIKPVISMWLKNGKVTCTAPVPEKINKLPEETFGACFSPNFEGETDPHINISLITKWAICAGTYLGGDNP